MGNVQKHNICINVLSFQTFRSYGLHSVLPQKTGLLIYNNNNNSGLNFSAPSDLLVHSVVTQAPRVRLALLPAQPEISFTLLAEPIKLVDFT
jgi:hypothetical protein